MRKLLKIIFIVVLSLVVLTTGYTIISGNYYLFFLLKNTVFKGRLGPNIDESEIYENRIVKKGEVQEWPVKYLNDSLTLSENEYFTDMGTAAFVVVKRDTVVFEYYDDEHGPKSKTNSWSVAKSITSLLVGAAIDDGLLPGVDVLISDFLPEYKGSKITLKHVLTMSSGINYDEHYLNPFSHSARALYDNDLYELNTHYQPHDEPGKVFDYQGGNTILLAMILKKVTGTTLAEYASEKLWKPMGASDDAYWSLDHKDGLEKAFCCFNTNAKDFARIGKLILHDGVWNGDTLISPSYIKNSVCLADLKMNDGSPNNCYGYMWWVLDELDYQGYYARGIQGQYIAVLPEEDLVVVRLGDRRPTTEINNHRIDLLYYLDVARRLAN